MLNYTERSQTMKADRVFMNAAVYSVAMDGTETRAQALAVKDGKFVYIGTNEGSKAFIGEGTEVRDCAGGSILPGFCDAHMHFINSVQRFGVVDLNNLATDPANQTPEEIIALMQQRIRAFAEKHPNSTCIQGSGWDRTWFTGGLSGIVRPITRHDIDAVVSDRPVVLSSFCGHVCLMNTKALEACGATKDMPDPPAGIIRREADGTPDGYIQEPVIIVPLVSKVPGYVFSAEQVKDGMLEAQQLFHSRGFTMLSDCMGNDPSYQMLKDMAESGELKVRIDGVFNANDATREADLENAISKRGTFDSGDMVKVDTVKYFVDGNLSMCEPYSDEYYAATGEEKGLVPLLWDEKNLMESMEKVQAAGFNIHVHAMGDYAAKYTVDCFINAQDKYNKDGKLRNIIAHCYYVKPEDKVRMGENGIIASIQPQWECETDITAPSETMLVGAERHHTAYPNRSLVDAGVVCAYGSDFTVTVPNALEGIQVAMTRRVTSKDPLYSAFKDVPAQNPSECVSLKEAVKAQTINGAYQFHREDITGSIELGKSAEFVVLDGNIENTPADRIVDLVVRETVFKGETVFKN